MSGVDGATSLLTQSWHRRCNERGAKLVWEQVTSTCNPLGRRYEIGWEPEAKWVVRCKMSWRVWSQCPGVRRGPRELEKPFSVL